MENIAKALLLAAAVMIGVFLLYNFTRSMDTTGEFTSAYMQRMDKERLAQYNSDFTKYTSEKITMYDVVSLMNKALYINENCNFDKNTIDYITVNIEFDAETGTAKNIKDLFLAKEFYEDGKFNYAKYNQKMFDYLKEYYDNAINWENAESIDKPKDWTNNNEIKIAEDAVVPAFKLTINKYTAGQVTEITFAEDGLMNIVEKNNN